MILVRVGNLHRREAAAEGEGDKRAARREGGGDTDGRLNPGGLGARTAQGASGLAA